MRFILMLMLAVLSVGSAWPGPYEDATAAYERGDHPTALRLFRPLAAQGDAGAQYNLGVLYERGQGVPQDYRDLAGERMNARQIAEAEKMARDCQARKFKGCD